jgi:prepilin-type N-terminal cleavage/methylation domain-containing protein
MGRNKHFYNKYAMTLIEVVLALSILSIGAFVLVHATAKCLAIIRLSRDYSNARTVLEQAVLEHPLNRTNSPEDNIVSPIKYMDRYIFSRTIKQTQGEEDLFIIISKVKWAQGEENSFEEVVTYLHCPDD